MTNQKPFDLEKFLAGEPARCRDPKIKIIDFKYWKNNDDEQNLELLLKINGSTYWCDYLDDGRCYESRKSDCDLFMAPKTKTLWIAVDKKEVYNENCHTASEAFLTKEMLLADLDKYNHKVEDYHIMQIEIEE